MAAALGYFTELPSRSLFPGTPDWATNQPTLRSGEEGTHERRGTRSTRKARGERVGISRRPSGAKTITRVWESQSRNAGSTIARDADEFFTLLWVWADVKDDFSWNTTICICLINRFYPRRIIVNLDSTLYPHTLNLLPMQFNVTCL